MNKMKKLLILFCFLLILTTFTGCPKPFLKVPTDYPGSTWSTEDGKVYFTVYDQSGTAYGYIETADGPVEIAVCISPLTSPILIYHADDARKLEEGAVGIQSVEIWHYSKCTKDKMVATVTVAKYFEEGQKLVFYRVS